MEEIILEYIKANPNCNGIDVATDLHISIPTAYKLIDELISSNKTEKIYFGIVTQLRIKE